MASSPGSLRVRDTRIRGGSTRLTRFAVAFVATAAAFLPCDALWLGAMSQRIYRPALGHLLAAGPDLLAVLLFYVLYLLGLVVFAVHPEVRAESRLAAGARGALFGLVAYATYDLTNQATLRDWPWMLTGIDLAWGSALSAFAATVAGIVVRRAGRN